MRKSFYCYQIHFSYASFCAIFVIERYCLTDNIASGKEGLDLLVQMENTWRKSEYKEVFCAYSRHFLENEAS